MIRSTIPALLLTSAVLLAQPPASRPAFEAVSVKVNNSGETSSSSNTTKGQMVMVNQSLKRLIQRAYEVQPIQVIGPEWMENVHFDISAKNPPDLKREDFPLLLQGLLEERFKLAIHRETQDFPGFALVTTKGGFKLKPVAAEGGMESSTQGGIVTTLTVKRATLAAIAAILGRQMNAPVIDQTGIAGLYDFEVRFTRDDREPNGSDADTVPTLASAVEEVLGLKLQRQKVPLSVIVVDRVERTPTEN